MFSKLLILLLCLAASSEAQLQPANSKVLLYFPHLADGGPVEQRWQTSLTFTNSDKLAPGPAAVEVTFWGDNGQPLALDFGSGSTTRLSFTLPARGIRVFQSRMASPSTVSGWAVASATYPIQGSLSFRMYSRGQASLEIAAHATSPTYQYLYPATSRLGVALVNISWSPITVKLSLRDRNGSALGEQSVVMASREHTAFNLWQKFANLTDDFVGTVEITVPTFAYFLAWAMGADASVMFSLPDGGYGWPPYHWERVWRVFQKLRPAAQSLADMTNVTLEISSEQKINAWATRDQVTVTYAMSEFIGDADSEVAAIVAHELGHVIQFRTGMPLSEAGADAMGTMLLLSAGYDPYAMLGMLGRLQAAAGAPGLLGQLLREFTDTHGSFPTRISTVMDMLNVLCTSSPDAKAVCQLWKGLFHPHFPPDMPLVRGAPSR